MLYRKEKKKKQKSTILCSGQKLCSVDYWLFTSPRDAPLSSSSIFQPLCFNTVLHRLLFLQLLANDILHERSVIFQCVKYVVANNFFDDLDADQHQQPSSTPDVRLPSLAESAGDPESKQPLSTSNAPSLLPWPLRLFLGIANDFVTSIEIKFRNFLLFVQILLFKFYVSGSTLPGLAACGCVKPLQRLTHARELRFRLLWYLPNNLWERWTEVKIALGLAYNFRALSFRFVRSLVSRL